MDNLTLPYIIYLVKQNLLYSKRRSLSLTIVSAERPAGAKSGISLEGRVGESVTFGPGVYHMEETAADQQQMEEGRGSDRIKRLGSAVGTTGERGFNKKTTHPETGKQCI